MAGAILAIGFGRGDGFLQARQAWKDDPRRPRLLHYVAIESTSAAQRLPFSGLTPGLHRFSFEQGRVLLTLGVGEAEPLLKELDFAADQVLLGEAEPSPGMAKAIARLCREGTTLVGTTASAQVRRDLASCGFVVEEGGSALRARFAPAWPVKGLRREDTPSPSHCIVIGAGLAGAAVAASLARRGWQVEVIDGAAQPAAGASALPVGLLAPHQSPDDNVLSRLSRAGVRITLQECESRLAAGEWQPGGVLEHRGADQRPVPGVPGLAPWTRQGSTEEAAAAGVQPPAWWHATAAWVRPSALIRAWLAEPGVTFRGGCAIHRIEKQEDRWRLLDAQGAVIAAAPLVVVAAAHASGPLLQGRISTHPVRGQVTWGLQGDVAMPPFPVNGHGHFVPGVPTPEGPAWFSGSTYGRGETDAQPRDADQAANLQRLRELLPAVAQSLAPQFGNGTVRAWSGVRCTSADRRPLVGELAPGLWASTAMGSRGLTFAALSAELIAARLHGEPLPLESRLARALEPR